MDIHNIEKIKLGNQIRTIRELKSLSQRLFASNCSIDERYLRKIEKGIANPSLDVLLNISKELELTISELLEGIA